VCKGLVGSKICREFCADGMIHSYAISIFVNKFADFLFTLNVNGNGAVNLPQGFGSAFISCGSGSGSRVLKTDADPDPRLNF